MDGPYPGSLLHISEHVAFTVDTGHDVDAWVDMVEKSDGIYPARIQVGGLPELVSLSIDDARTLADALNELVTAEENR